MTEPSFSELAPYRAYKDALARGVLAFQQCEQCRRAIFYPRVNCPHCGGTRLRWRDSAGLGTVYSISEVADKAGSYNVALIDLDEGFRMMGTVLGAATAAIGQRVRARVETMSDEARVVFEVSA